MYVIFLLILNPGSRGGGGDLVYGLFQRAFVESTHSFYSWQIAHSECTKLSMNWSPSHASGDNARSHSTKAFERKLLSLYATDLPFCYFTFVKGDFAEIVNCLVCTSTDFFLLLFNTGSQSPLLNILFYVVP